MQIRRILVLLINVFPLVSFAQTAKQGDAKSDPTEFHSPMILEAPFIAAHPNLWSGVKNKNSQMTSEELGQLRRFHCDGLSITNVMLHADEVPKNRVDTIVEISVRNPGHDKFVKLLLQLFNGENKVGEVSIGPFKDKEGATVTQRATLAAAKADLKTDPLTTLRITMTDWDY